MRKLEYKIEVDGSLSILQLTWQGLWKNLKVLLDGRELGQFTGINHLKSGQSFPLKDGSVLNIKLIYVAWAPVISVLRDGEPVQGSGTDPLVRIDLAYKILVLLAAFNLLVSAVVFLWEPETLIRVGYGYYNFLLSMVFAMCVLIGWRTRSFWPLLFSLVVFLFDTSMAMKQHLLYLSGSSMAIIVVRIFVASPLVFGAFAAWRRRR